MSAAAPFPLFPLSYPVIPVFYPVIPPKAGSHTVATKPAA